jgi:hypothetical protein
MVVVELPGTTDCTVGKRSRPSSFIVRRDSLHTVSPTLAPYGREICVNDGGRRLVNSP